MASIPFLKSFLPTSTPVHQNKDDNCSKSFKRIFISSTKGLDEPSPIKEILPSNLTFSSYLSDLDNQNLTVSDFALPGRNENCAIRAAKKLRFADFSNTIEKNNLKNFRNFENDSGFGSVDILSPEVEKSPDLKLMKTTDVNCSFQCDKCFCKRVTPLCEDEVSVINKYKQSLDIIRQYHPFRFLNNRKATGIFHKPIKGIIESSENKGFDLVSQLYWMNCTSVLSQLLSYLSNEDIRNASNVNKTWRSVIFQDTKANARRDIYLKEKKEIVTGPNKENRFCSKVIQEKDHKRAFSDMTNEQNKYSEQPLDEICNIPSCEAIIELKNLRNHGLVLKCPKCHSPSEIVSGNRYCCNRKLCRHFFCKKCFGPYLDNHVCSLVNLDDDLPKIIIGSRKSKKNLRRL